MLETSPVAPPVVELGRIAGWQPLPLSVREARRRTRDLPEALAHPPVRRSRPRTTPVLEARGVDVRYGATVAVRGVDITVARGEVVALMGRNGCGKSSLLWALQGSGRRDGGVVRVDGTDPAGLSADRARALVGLVPQTASDLLYLETVRDECAAADDQAGVARGTCRALLDRLASGVVDDRHPRDLSEGQRLALVLALVLTTRPAVLALDEPTRGLDYAAKSALADTIGSLAADGHGVLVATHDVEFVARVADQVVVMAGGEVVSAGTTDRVLAESPAFAPQMSKILGDGWLTVQQVREAIAS
jgi:energy-coupling factor transport system ATP-binding protein